MKKAELVFTAILVPLDAFMLFLAGLEAYSLRFSPSIADARPVVFDLPWDKYLGLLLLTIPLFLLIFAITGLYNTKISRPLWSEFLSIAVSVSASIMIITFFTFLRREIFSSRFIIIFAWVFALISVTFGRVVIKFIQRWLVGKYNYGVQRVVIIGSDKLAKIISREIINRPGMGYRIIGKDEHFDIKELEKLDKKVGFDEIIFCNNPASYYEKGTELLDFCIENRKDLKFVPAIFADRSANIEMQSIAGVPVIELKRTPLDGWGKIIKRTFDIIGAAVCIIIFSPVMLAVAMAVKLDSSGPVIYKNERVGPGKNFDTLKFRSMKAKYCTGRQFGNHKSLEFQNDLIKKQSVRRGPVYKIKDDPRVTRVGKFIRSTSLDELPQLFNVLKGEMSLVGPRPHQPIEVEKYSNHHKKVLAIKPGITGMAQVSGRSDLDFDEEVRLDYYYIENWSLLLDLRIIFKTPFAVLAKRKVA